MISEAISRGSIFADVRLATRSVSVVRHQPQNVSRFWTRWRRAHIDGFGRSQADLAAQRRNHVQELFIRDLAQVPAADRAGMLQLQGSFAPFRPGLEPEYLRRDIAAPGRIEKEARDLGIGLGLSEIQLLTVKLAQRLRIDPDHTGYF